MTLNGDKLEVALADAQTARIGRQQITLGTTDQAISLTAKHVGVQFSTRIAALVGIPYINATIESTGSNIPQRVSYNPVDGSYTSIANGVMAATPNDFSGSTDAIRKYSESYYGQRYASWGNESYYTHYFLPTTDVKNLKLTFTSGTLYWKPLTRKSINNLTSQSHQLVANGNYRVLIKMKPQYTYLMSNGSTGSYKATVSGGGDKIPIAVVLNENTAIALKDVGSEMKWANILLHNGAPNSNTYCSANDKDLIQNSTTSGYDETWNAGNTTSSITGNKIKGLNQDFPPFYAAAHYNPGVTYTGTPALQWFLPSSNDFKEMFSILGFGDKSKIKIGGTQNHWYGFLIDMMFTQVGGTVMAEGGNYWTSSEIKNGYAAFVRKSNQANWLYAPSLYWFQQAKGAEYNVRPFVRYK